MNLWKLLLIVPETISFQLKALIKKKKIQIIKILI